jgi:hypothetical protein
MNITDLKSAKDAYTGRASDVVRQFAFAGIAVIWLLKTTNTSAPIPRDLIPILALFGLALACDLLQYAVSSVIWVIYYRHKLGQHIAETTEFKEPRWITAPAYLLFIFKVVVALVAWVCLVRYLCNQWNLI